MITLANSPVQLPAHDRVLRMPELVARSGLSRATLYRRIKRGEFPPLQSLGGQTVGLPESLFLTWLAVQRLNLAAAPARKMGQ